MGSNAVWVYNQGTLSLTSPS